MLKKTLAALVLGSALIGAQAMAADYVIDKKGQHAFVNFKISHLGYSWLYGTFKDFDGKFSFDAAKPEASKVSVTLKTASVDTNHAERDKHIASADFLENHYHKVSDEVTLPIDWNAAARFAVVNTSIARTIADGDRPLWYADSPFASPDRPTAQRPAN